MLFVLYLHIAKGEGQCIDSCVDLPKKFLLVVFIHLLEVHSCQNQFSLNSTAKPKLNTTCCDSISESSSEVNKIAMSHVISNKSNHIQHQQLLCDKNPLGGLQKQLCT